MGITLARWTVEEYHRMIAAGVLRDRPVELLQGQVVEMSPEGPLHAHLNRNLGDWFRAQLGERAVVSEGKPITLGTDSEPQPDLALVRPRSYRDRHPGPEDIFLLIELANTSLAKDTDEKRQIYAAAGIADYWVVDLQTQTDAPTILVYREPGTVAGPADYQSVQRLNQGRLSPLAFPEIGLDVQALAML